MTPSEPFRLVPAWLAREISDRTQPEVSMTEQPTPDPTDAAVDAAVAALQKERGLNTAQAINTALTVLRASEPVLRAQIADEIEAMFIAAARTDVPALLGHIETLRTQVLRLLAQRDVSRRRERELWEQRQAVLDLCDAVDVGPPVVLIREVRSALGAST